MIDEDTCKKLEEKLRGKIFEYLKKEGLIKPIYDFDVRVQSVDELTPEEKRLRVSPRIVFKVTRK